MTALIVPAAASLAASALTFAGTAYLERSRDRRAAKRERERAIVELLAATTDLTTGIQIVRTAHGVDNPAIRWTHDYARRGAELLVAAGSVMTDGNRLTRKLLGDWHRMSPGLERLLAVDRGLDDNRRTIVLDANTIVAPRTQRFYEAVMVFTRDPDREVADAARELAGAIGAFLKVIAANGTKYTQAHARAEAALDVFRDAASRHR